MKKIALAASLLLLSTVALAAAPKPHLHYEVLIGGNQTNPPKALSPEARWKADLADTNKHYSVVVHGILKIQDAAYLGEGNAASLVGTSGKPDSYKWKTGEVANAALVALYSKGKLAITRNGKPAAHPMLPIPVDADVDIQAFPTQVQAGVMGVRIFV